MKFFTKVMLAATLTFSTVATVTPVEASYVVPQIGDTTSAAYSATFSPDGNYLVTGHKDNISIWNAKSMSLIQKNTNIQGSNQLFFNKAGTVLFNRYTSRLTALDFETNEIIYQFDKSAIVNSALSADEKTLYVLTSSVLYFVNAITGEAVQQFSLSTTASSLAYNNTTNELAVASKDGTITIRDGATGDYIHTLPYTGNQNYTEKTLVRYSPDDAQLYRIYASADFTYSRINKLTVYDVADNYTTQPNWSETLLSSFYSISNFTITPNNEYMFISGYIGNYGDYTYVVELQGNTHIATIEEASALAASPNSSRFFVNNTLYNIANLPSRKVKAINLQLEQSIIGIDDFKTVQVIEQFEDDTTQAVKTSDVTWSSSNTKVANFVAGKLHGVAPGEATITATYKGKSIAKQIIVRDYIEEPKSAGVAADKTWTVEFSANVNAQTIKEQNMYVTNAQDEIVPMLYYVEQNNQKNVQLMPVKPYTSGETYTLWIKDVKSASNTSLEKFTKKQFTIK